MSIQIGICDDNESDIKILSEALFAYDPSFQISTYSDGEALLEECLEQRILFDILFLDIYMPGLNGIETAGKIRACMNDAKIIFISSSNEHYPEAYDVFAFNYILKPLASQNQNHILNQALKDVTRKRCQQIDISNKSKSHRVLCGDIQYIESRDKILYFHMADKTTLQCYAKLDEILRQLPQETFIRCHQSFVVNIFHVTEMVDKHFRIDPAVISISKKHLKESKEKYFAYLFAHLNRGQ